MKTLIAAVVLGLFGASHVVHAKGRGYNTGITGGMKGVKNNRVPRPRIVKGSGGNLQKLNVGGGVTLFGNTGSFAGEP